MKIELWIKLKKTGRWSLVDSESLRMGDHRTMAQLKLFLKHGREMLDKSPDLVVNFKIVIT